ncbi:hypothetical protein SmJEL517_g01660 [Synchytrium microbalum]|uniref:Uncharacterized protein n=1 Tax=Synchytrium microbalum TaxID=1806994 RepID=A0A507CFA0_9FUNG|nr:uncharacterized protein SmJEL517_g01660 [Synchytrium microbalum]TPX36265.1 hypothetical protein SmJEL517_g01660 [Synchytrium microbalum]
MSRLIASSLLSRRIATPALIAPAVLPLQRRNIWERPAKPLKASFTLIIQSQQKNWEWSKVEVEEKVLDMLLDAAKVDEDKITLEANLSYDLLMDDRERFGLYWDLQEEFQFNIAPLRRFSRDLASGREAADWVASYLEQHQRLRF